MVGMDDSECSHYALRWALQNLGQTLSRSHLLLISAQSLLEFRCVFACSFANLNVRRQSKFAFCLFVFLVHATYGWCFCGHHKYVLTAVDLINDLQENQRKATLSLLANAKEICAKHGVWTLPSANLNSLISLHLLASLMLLSQSRLVLAYVRT